MNVAQSPDIEPLALFGGTFDPVHYGHLRCAEEARQKLKLKHLYLLPAGTPQLRNPPKTSAEQRLEMLQLALSEFPALCIDDRETRRSGPSYMVDTLRELRAECGDRPILLILGQDAVNHLHKWYEWEQLFNLASIIVLSRPGANQDYRSDVAKMIQRRTFSDLDLLMGAETGGVFYLDVAAIDISATTIKSIIRLGRSPESLLPGPVLEYIHKNRLYLPDH